MRIAIVGAGAAGLMAAASIQNCNDTIVVFDKNEKAGKKLYITGKGRCNFTNDCSAEDFLRSVVTNPKFLYSSIYGFTPQDAIDFFKNFGCASKTERGGRVFPVSDKASDVTKALTIAAQKNGAQIVFDHNVSSISHDGKSFILSFFGGEQQAFDKIILASGGKSYPSTGSTGDGYRFAAGFGHTIIEPKPSLVSIGLKQDVAPLSGLSLKNVEAQISLGSKKRKEFGEMLFTHSGVSGPIILSLSSYFARENLQGGTLSINLKPALTSDALDKRVLRDFEAERNRQLKNALDNLLPKSLISYIIDHAGLDGSKPVNNITKQERQRLVDALTNLKFQTDGAAGFEEAIITSGGVNVKEINPSTMESKLAKGLFFAGEVIDVDALTGGFNIQIALSTARLAGKNVKG